jgi:hypothetical protein
MHLNLFADLADCVLLSHTPVILWYMLLVLHALVLIIQQLLTYEFAYIVPQQICNFQSCAAL